MMKRSRASAVSERDWQRVRSFIESNYDSMTVRSLLHKLHEEHGLSLTSRQLNYQLGKWGLRKYNKQDRQDRPNPAQTPQPSAISYHAPFLADPNPRRRNQVVTQLSRQDQIKKSEADLLHALVFDRHAFPIYKEICKTHELSLDTIHVSWYRAAETPEQIDEIAKRIQELVNRAQNRERWLLSLHLARLQDRKAALTKGTSAEDSNIQNLMNGLLASPDCLHFLPTPCEGFDLVTYDLISVALERMKEGQPDDFVDNARCQFLLGHLPSSPKSCVARECLLWMKEELETLRLDAVTDNFEIDLVLNLWRAAITLPSETQLYWLTTTGPMLNIPWVELLYTLCFMAGTETDSLESLDFTGGMAQRAKSGVGELLKMTHFELWDYISEQFSWTSCYDPSSDEDRDLLCKIQRFAKDTLR